MAQDVPWKVGGKTKNPEGKILVLNDGRQFNKSQIIKYPHQTLSRLSCVLLVRMSLLAESSTFLLEKDARLFLNSGLHLIHTINTEKCKSADAQPQVLFLHTGFVSKCKWPKI